MARKRTTRSALLAALAAPFRWAAARLSVRRQDPSAEPIVAAEDETLADTSAPSAPVADPSWADQPQEPAGPVTEIPPEAAPAPEPEPAGVLTPSIPGEPTPEPEPEPEPEPKPEVAPRPESVPAQSERADALVAVPDPEAEGLLAKIADIEGRLVELSARHNEMQGTLQSFQIQQFRALGQALAECLQLRHEYARRRAERSGTAEDAAEARRSAEDLDGFRRKCSTEPEPPPELDEETRAELKRVYRTVAMRCHPDRVPEAQRETAHQRFQVAQRAYRERDLERLRTLLREIEADPGSVREPAHARSSEALRRTLSALRGSAADLILAIQTLQLDPDYRRALRRDEWEDYFLQARRGFELECEQLRAAIAAL